MGKRDTVALSRTSSSVQRHPIGQEPIEILRKGDSRRVDSGAALRLRDQFGAPGLRLPLGPGEAMPTALARAGLRIAQVDDDGPMAGGAFTKMSFHDLSPSLFLVAQSRKSLSFFAL